MNSFLFIFIKICIKCLLKFVLKFLIYILPKNQIFFIHYKIFLFKVPFIFYSEHCECDYDCECDCEYEYECECIHGVKKTFVVFIFL